EVGLVVCSRFHPLGDLRIFLTRRVLADAAWPALPPVAKEKEDWRRDENGRTGRNHDTEYHRNREALNSGAAPDRHRQQTQECRQGGVDAPREYLIDAQVDDFLQRHLPIEAQV